MNALERLSDEEVLEKAKAGEIDADLARQELKRRAADYLLHAKELRFYTTERDKARLLAIKLNANFDGAPITESLVVGALHGTGLRLINNDE